MTHGSLFSGIGGAELAAEWVGWDNVFHCEINPFGRKVLDYYWPNATSYEDIKTTDFSIWRGRIDILTGGFPCQPFSAAGKRKGTEDDRHLWPEMLRAIKEIEPRWIVGENVFGLVNWNDGMVFEQVQADLENEGYEVQPYILPAVSVDAPHRRDRIWFVAHASNHNRRTAQGGWNEKRQYFFCQPSTLSIQRTTSNAYIGSERSSRSRNCSERKWSKNHDEQKLWGKQAEQYNRLHDVLRDASYSSHKRLQRIEIDRIAGGGRKERNEQFTGCIRPDWQNFPTESPVRQRDDGISSRMVGFVTINLYERIINTNKENRIEDLPKVWKEIQSKEIWEKIRRLYSLESKEILFQTMQLYTTGYKPQIQLSPFSEKFCEPVLQYLWKHGEFRRSPQGQELEKQRFGQSTDPLPFLPHEVALAARRFESAVTKFDSWHAKESIKAYGNAWVPQVAYQIFKAIEEYGSNDNI